MRPLTAASSLGDASCRMLDASRTLPRSSEAVSPPRGIDRISKPLSTNCRAVQHAEDDWHFDRFGLMDGVVVPAPSEGPSILASPRLAPMVILISVHDH